MSAEPSRDPASAGVSSAHLNALIADVIARAPVDQLLSVDGGLEGAWTESARTLWSRHDGLSDATAFDLRDNASLPCLELMFPGGWIGVRCSVRQGDHNVLDQRLARTLIRSVEQRLAGRAPSTPVEPNFEPG